MAALALAYLVGTLFGELGLLAWWAMAQTARVTPADYVRQKWASALFAFVVALTGCLLWAEGSLASRLGGGVALTLGYSVAVGMGLTFFAHLIVAVVAARFGLNPPAGDPPKGD